MKLSAAPQAGSPQRSDKLRGIKAKFAEANPPLKIKPEWRTNPPSLAVRDGPASARRLTICVRP